MSVAAATASRPAPATPTRRASSSATACASSTRSTATRRRRSCSSRPSPISHSRLWKAQVPYLSRHFRVVTFDPRGNGRSDRPSDGGRRTRWWEFVADGRAVLEATGADDGARRRRSATAAAGRSCSPRPTRRPCSASPRSRPFVPRLTPSHPNYRSFPSDEPLDTDEGWAKCNIHYWRRDYRGFLEFFFSQQIPEPHSTKQIEDCVSLGARGRRGALDPRRRGGAAALGEPRRRPGRSASASAARCS